MNKKVVHYLAILPVTIFCVPFVAAYTNSECTMAKELADDGIVYKESDCRDYHLDRTIYRQEVAALALRVAEKCNIIDDIPEIEDYDCEDVFYDVSSTRPNSWVCRSVEILADNNIVTTSRRDTFGRPFFQPMKDITKSEALSMIMDSAGFEFRGERYDDWRFTGTGAVNWQKPVMQYAQNNRIISSISSFRPNNVAYRREVFAYAQKSIEHCKDLYDDDFDNNDDDDNNDDTDNFYITTDDSSPDTNEWVDVTIRARDGSSSDTSYRGSVDFDVYYRRSSSSSWTKTTSSSYYEIDEDYEDGYTFTSSNDGQKTFTNFIRFRKDDYQYKIVVTDDDDDDIEGYKIFTIGDYSGSDCGLGEYESGGNCYACTGRPSYAYYTEEGSCEWSCNSGYIKRNGVCEYDSQTCGIGQYLSGNTCYNCTTKPSSASYTNYGTCDWSCNTGYYRDGNTCVQNTLNCGVGQIANGTVCQSCVSAPANSYYTTAGSCSWACNANYYASGNQCIPYTQNCGVGQYLNGNVCVNCNGKPSNSLYSQTGTCDWVCEYGYTRDSNSCVPTQNYSWYTGNWNSCNVSCGGGTQSRIVECRSNIGYVVNDWQCTGTKPATTQSCNTQACTTYSWYTGSWGTCSGGSQTRSVVCKNSNNTTVNDSYCSGTKPATTQSCTSWTYSWKVGNWGTCVNNNQDRTVVCERNDGNIVSSSYCDIDIKPETSRSCSSVTYSWVTGSWGTCSGGSQTRSVVCKNSNNTTVNDSYCSGTKPATTQSCTTYSWYRGDINNCVATCNTTRTVVCKNSSGQTVADSYCTGTKPGHVCNRALAWVNTNGSQSCNTVCNNLDRCWVKDDQNQACASGQRVPTWGTFNFIYGTVTNPTTGGYWVWPYNGSWYCGSANQSQEPTYTDKNKVIACLCQ